MNIQVPTEQDSKNIAVQIVHAEHLIKKISGEDRDRSIYGLTQIQKVLDSGQIKRNETYALQALGLILGQIIIENNAGFDFWIIDDEYGRDPTVRYLETTLCLNTMTMISKRVEDEEIVDVAGIYHGVLNHAAKVIAEELD